MNIYDWSRAQTDEERVIYRKDDSPPPLEPTTITAHWNGAPTPLLIDPLFVNHGYYFAFRPIGAPEAQAFVVGFVEWGGRVDEFGWQDTDALQPYSYWSYRDENWLSDVVKNIENGCYGQFDAERHTEDGHEGWLWNFFGSRGRVVWDFTERRVGIGSFKKPGFYQLCYPKFSPDLSTTPWCAPERAPALLGELNSVQLDERLERESADPKTPAGFARAWANWSHQERRAQLPALERQIENELARVMKWAFWSAPALRETSAFPFDAAHPQQWFRPRFVVQNDNAGGHFFFNENYLSQPHAAIVKSARARLEALWPHFAAAFEVQRAQLRAERERLPPSLAHWCHRRGCYSVNFEAPTMHEKLESHVALRDWLRARAGVELDEIERDLEAKP